MLRSCHKFYRKLFLAPSFAVAVLVSFVCEYYPCSCPLPPLPNLIKVGSRTYVSQIHSNSFCIGMHICITIYLDLNQPTTFAANLLHCRGGSKNPTTFETELFATIVNSQKLLTIIGKCLILVMAGFMDQSLTINCDC